MLKLLRAGIDAYKMSVDGPKKVPEIARSSRSSRSRTRKAPYCRSRASQGEDHARPHLQPPKLNQLFNQSNMMVTVETDIGITGIGEGGAKDTLEQCAGTLIGKNPFRIEAIWQEMYIAWFYPPGREKIHALGALDLALWDIKGKALKLPVHELLGGSRARTTASATPPAAARAAGAGTAGTGPPAR